MSSLSLKQEHGITIAKRRTTEQLLRDEGPYARLLFDLVVKAKELGASDIHIEPTESGVDMRLRVDGNLIKEKNIDLEHRESLILEVKRIFGLAIGISGRPQDGRASLPEMRLDLRVSLLPTHFGEKIVMRLLNLDASFDLSQLGFMEKERAILEKATRFENGVVIVSGPTGSGKTRTLYSLLKAIDPRRYNIVTLEDPIEYRIAGLNQVQVSKKITFADALRSVLRQDPDVILVGEVRDPETAKLCFQAAETGHLVFTTLHANGALEVMDRLSGLGVDKLLLETNLRLSIAQRLEQRVCSTCAKSPPPHVVQWYSERDKRKDPSVRLIKSRNEQGCSICHFGISGRVPTLEWALFEVAGEKKVPCVVQSLMDARILRALCGETDCMEVFNAIS